ncbi:MAG: L-fuculose-phosphate aldolase [Halanaerobiales bacterium]|nr:L-fuculose-phosphate aldolase [Halanaerobiales bacterium]
MLLEKERQLITKYGNKLIELGITRQTGGNLSIFNRNESLMAISPSAIPYSKISAEKVVVMDLNKKKIEGDNKPSSEYELHRIIYEKRKAINSVVHTHPTYATTIACLKEEIPPIHYLIAFAGLKVPCASYARFGTKKLAKNVYKAMGSKYNAVLLANHGLISVGKDIKHALTISEMVEFCAELYYRAKAVGKPEILSKKQIKRVIENLQDYQKKQ